MTELAVAPQANFENDFSGPDLDGGSVELIAEQVPMADRADAPVSEVTERFLRAVIAKVPLERIEELHLFAPLRQGGVETGIAVVAARTVIVVEAPPAAVVAEDIVADDVVAEDVMEDVVAEDVVAEDVVAEVVVVTDEVLIDETAVNDIAVDEAVVDGESPYADDAFAAAVDSVAELPALIEPATRLATIVRHTVYTARYRLVLKGPERGLWEADVVDEADAPLLTVETVVRGVQRRAGEETEILRYTERQIARALRIPWPATTDAPAA